MHVDIAVPGDDESKCLWGTSLQAQGTALSLNIQDRLPSRCNTYYGTSKLGTSVDKEAVLSDL